MTPQRFDVVIIGGGPGGYVAAIRAAQLGLKTALVEMDALGGTCLNWGCIPTKTLLHGADLIHRLSSASDFGIGIGIDKAQIKIDLPTLVARSRSVAGRLRDGVAHLLKKNGVTPIHGRAQLLDKGRVAVTTKAATVELAAAHIIVATGARTRTLPNVDADSPHIWNYRDAMTPTALPQSLLVIGSGAIGLEFASFYRDLGSAVTVIEMADQLLPNSDTEIAGHATTALQRRGIAVRTSCRLEQLAADAEGVCAHIVTADGKSETLRAAKAIVAIGVQGNTEGLGLESVGVTLRNSFVMTDAWCKTNAAGVYAIGDVAGAPCLAHKASHEALLCIEKIAGIDGVKSLDRSAIPAIVYSRPQIASMGMTECAAKKAGREIRVGRFSLQSNGMAIASGESDGMIKTIVDAHSGELLGSHMIGTHIADLAGTLAVAKALEATDSAMAAAIFPHPTLSEAIHESFLSALGHAIHQ